MLSVTVQRKLESPFPNALIKQRKQQWTDRRTGETKTMYFDYVETASVIARLNATFGHDWSFEVIESNQMEKQVMVLGRLTAHGVTHMAYGGDTQGPGDEGLINAYKSAVGDAIKLCAKQFGVGLHLWMND
jgi:hypothetical protein